MTNDEEFERCWAVMVLRNTLHGGWFDSPENRANYKKLFRDNWDKYGGLEWFNKIQEESR
jgi:hypothetical protein